MKPRFHPPIIAAVLAAAILPPALYAQEGSLSVAGVTVTGEAAVAARYADWAETTFREGDFLRAEAFLERAADYAPVSSDLSYLLALTRRELSRPARETLTAARLALATDRWALYLRQDALMFEAEMLIRIRRYGEALNVISELEEGERTAELRLLALEHLPYAAEFEAAMEAALERYPRSPRFPRILFRREARNQFPGNSERSLVDKALKRLPALLEADGDLIRYATPFITGRDEARRLLAAWRATGGSRKLRQEALPVCLETGLIDERTALDELFAPSGEVDRDVLLAVWDLLRTDEARQAMSGRLTAFSGMITTDENGDGVTDSRSCYRAGVLVSYALDADQDGVNEMAVMFGSDESPGMGWPVSAELVYASGAAFGGTEKISITWERYPALREAVIGDTRWLFRPMEASYPALSFRTAGGPGGILLAGPDPRAAAFTRGMIAGYAYRIERPGRDFPGGIEAVECEGGVIHSAKEYVDGRLAAETFYEGGVPVFQRIDLDLDGRMETTRRFDPPVRETVPSDMNAAFEIASIESDFDGDGIAEYREIY
ncbi:MAG: hypothetical protein LBJ86_06735 [Spirochaetaceae bacterium]|jgi:hypothetical protein|nr:hypothetical protein [Spirochaetaceae bacterium]